MKTLATKSKEDCPNITRDRWGNPAIVFWKGQLASCLRLGLARANLLYGFQKTMAILAILFWKRAGCLLPAPYFAFWMASSTAFW